MKPQILPLDLPPAFDQQNFIVSPSNKEAYEWIKRWPNWPHPCLSIYGEMGCGKTHLSHIWQAETQAKRLNGRDFDKAKLESLLEGLNLFVLDNADFVQDEEKFFHFYNHIIPSKGGMLLLSPTPPARWTTHLPDLQSRLKTVPAIKISPPDEKLIGNVLQKLFQDKQVKVDQSVIEFLLKHMERSFESAKTWVEKLDTLALSQKRNITIPLVREILEKEAEKH